MNPLIERVLAPMRVHSPGLFAGLRKAWWLLRWRRLPPRAGQGLGQDHARYLEAMDVAIAQTLRNTPPTLSIQVWLLSDAQTSPEQLQRSLDSLRTQSHTALKIVLCGPLTHPELECVASPEQIVAAPDIDVRVAMQAGCELVTDALAALAYAFALSDERIKCLVPDQRHAHASGYRLAPWRENGVEIPAVWAWRGDRPMPQPSKPAPIDGLAHLPAALACAAPLRVAQAQGAPVSRATISVIVPTRDGGAVLGECLRGVLAELAALGAEGELLVVDNGSRDACTLELLNALAAAHPDVMRVLRYDHPFNYSAINNWAVQQASGEQILLLNDDIQSAGPGWLAALRAELARPRVAAVGARLLYPNGCIQHAGVALGLGGVAGHPGRTLKPEDARWAMWPHDQRRQVSAVTGACLLTTRALYWSVDGLNQQALSVAFNDVDFCLKLGEAGGAVVYTPNATLIHHESMSRGAEDSVAKQRRFAEEIRYMQQRWPEVIKNDPFYSAHLSRELDDLSFRSPCGATLLSPSLLPPLISFTS